MRHRLLVMLGLLTLCAALAACGGSTTATATTVSPTRAATAASGAASAPASAAATTAPTVAAASGSAAAATRPAGSASAPGATTAPTTAPATVVAASAPTVAPATAAPATSASSVATTAAPSAASGGNVVMVQLKDFMIALDKSTVTAGMVTFTIKNNGPSPHNFNVKINGEEKGVPTLDAGMTATVAFDLKPGSYDYRCNIPGHDLLGMKGTLTVK
ncbi:MAG: cupredoxin domain-containing protein [Chloroflexota bacterium]|nr:cupredoxin domain-containing protein [Chloroflexota bacterium]